MSSELIGADKVQRVAVLGAGTMGHGIAQVAAMAGLEVILRDVEARFVTAGLDRVRANLDKGVALGKVDAAARDAALRRLSATMDLAAAVSGADLVIEAVPEILALKQETFAAIDAAAPEHAVLATNTSSLSIGAIASAARRPGRVVGMHFFNPVHLMKLVEVVRHDAAEEAAVECARGFAARIGKTAITVRDAPGFASSRLGVALGLEAIRMVEQAVASPADIDTAMRLGYGHPMGPLELGDLIGLDVRLHIAEYLHGELGASFAPPELLRQKVAAGELGAKTGQGFYAWRDGKRVE